MSSDRSLSRALQQATEPSDSSPSRIGSGPSKRRQSAPNNSTRSGNSDAHPSRAPANVNGLQSEPMTTTTSSSSSEVPAMDPVSSSTTPAPYGTRSRGKNGAPRPNYAEDHDGDMEFEVTSPPPKSGSVSKRGAASIQNTTNGSPEVESDKGPGITTRRGQTTANGTNPQSASSIPGTSSFSTTSAPSSTSTRKRKQPGGSTKKASASASGAAKRSFSNMMSFEKCGARLNNGQLKADNGTMISVNDHVYLICEPPGEPYYLARIMEFLPPKEDPSGPVEAVRVNWYYRPRDIQRKAMDARVVFASMHSDTCPLASLRGKCSILHISEVDDLEEYRKRKDCFWYEKMYDRYILRSYEVIPTSKVINVPENVKKVLDERWKFVLVEMGRRKELTSEVKTCKRCGSYAASSDSVDCAVCRSTYHMFCVRPVLTKKPARGFAWACAACSRAQERKLEARNTPIINEAYPDAEEETLEEEEEEPNGQTSGTGRSSPIPGEGKVCSPRPATAEQMAHARMWPYRYLGIHCRVEDALDYDDRIYPRASSRLGPRHQATVLPWTGRPVEYVKAPDAKKKFVKGSGYRGNMKPSKEALAALEAEKKEKLKYLPRGEDEVDAVAGDQVRTAQLLFRMPESSEIPARGEDDAPDSELSEAEREKFIDDYMKRARSIAPEKGVEKYSTNFLDKALEFLYAESFNAEAALARLKRINKYSDLQEPHLRPEEVKLFEEGVARYGSELRNVTKHVKTVPHRHIVRFYYMWKKTPRGRQIWGNYEGRRGKKEAKRADSSAKLVDDVADDHDDSAFDNDKAVEKKRRFECKFCATRSSPQWRRAPGTPPGTLISVEPSSRRGDKGLQLTVALCLQCSLLWRKYAIRWENVDEVAKKINQGSNKWRRRVDEELLTQLLVSTETPINISSATAATATSIGVNVMTTEASQEPAKKKAKLSDKDSNATSASASVEPVPKKKQTEKAPEPPPLAPDPPRAKTLPCAVCDKMEPMGDEHLSCRDCRLTVHRGCYGISPSQNCTKWFCDMCLNDRNPTISTCYECVLCPVSWTELELMESPKTVHKRKSDREKEKERLEKEMVAEAIKLYRQRQEAVGKPIGPREPLKRTAGNNWVHVMCAIWTPEIKFGSAKELEPAEGFALIPADRFKQVCKICKKIRGACVPCQHSGCDAQFHVGCAFQAQYVFGFEITPVKPSRRDSAMTIKLGEETGSATAAIWCPDHSTGPTRHQMSEPTELEGLNALQVFTQKFKQADLSLTGTVRKAAHMQQSIVGVSLQNGVSSSNRRASGANGVPKDGSKSSGALPDDVPEDPPVSSGEGPAAASRPVVATDACKKCVLCSSTCSPRWWTGEGASQVPDVSNGTPLPNGAASSDPVTRRYSSTTSATPPFHARNHSQSSVSRVNGESSTPDRPAGAMPVADATHQPSLVSYECHKCHVKKPVPPSSPELRPSPFLSQRAPILPNPAPRLPEYVNHTYAPPPPHPPPGVLPQSLGPSHLHNGPEWYPGYDPRPGEFVDQNLRNGLVPGGPNGIPAPSYYSAPPQHLNSYPPASHTPAPHPPHYPSGAPPPPPPHSYSPHQNPYAPVPMSSPHHSHATLPRNYGTSTSPPNVHANIARHSPQRSLSGGPQPRVYSVDRVLAAPGTSPSISRSSVDPQLPPTPGKPEEPPVSVARPTSGGRYASNGTGTGSAASASPSLKNLLS